MKFCFKSARETEGRRHLSTLFLSIFFFPNLISELLARPSDWLRSDLCELCQKKPFLVQKLKQNKLTRVFCILAEKSPNRWKPTKVAVFLFFFGWEKKIWECLKTVKLMRFVLLFFLPTNGISMKTSHFLTSLIWKTLEEVKKLTSFLIEQMEVDKKTKTTGNKKLTCTSLFLFLFLCQNKTAKKEKKWGLLLILIAF